MNIPIRCVSGAYVYGDAQSFTKTRFGNRVFDKEAQALYFEIMARDPLVLIKLITLQVGYQALVLNLSLVIKGMLI